MNDRDQLQLEQAARGCVSGTLAEWPLLQAALKRCGVNLPATADRAEMIAASAECLGQPE